MYEFMCIYEKEVCLQWAARLLTRGPRLFTMGPSLLTRGPGFLQRTPAYLQGFLMSFIYHLIYFTPKVNLMVNSY